MTDALSAFISRHDTAFATVSYRETVALEIGALVLSSEHYERAGYSIAVRNLKSGYFRLKLKNGHPRGFSWYEACTSTRSLEIHGNLSVQGAYGSDGGRYMVDVGVVTAGMLPPTTVRARDWEGMPNTALVTFIESKKLEIYPMLLAQFVGIVHEIMPRCLDPVSAPAHRDDFYPALVSIGSLRATSRAIRAGFRDRGFRVNILPGFDSEITLMARDPARLSPFESPSMSAWEEEH